MGGTWGSLCATGWDLPDAHVLCRHLGCGAAIAVLPGGSFGAGDGPMWRDGFGCDGNEWHPGQCPAAVLGEPPCPPGHTAAVNCSGVCGNSPQGLWGTLRLGSEGHRVLWAEGRAEPPSPQGLYAAGAAAPRHCWGCCRCCRSPAAGGGGEPVRRAAGGDHEPRDMGPRGGGAVGHRAWQRGVPAAGLRRAGESLWCAGLGHRGAAVCRHRGEPGTVQRLRDGPRANWQPRGGGRRLLG